MCVYIMCVAGVDSCRLLEDVQKSKYFTRTVKFIQVTLIKQSNV